MKYIFVTGGVISSIGKGITVSSIGKILQAKGYRVTCIKCDMYVNIDAGTMRPTEHGEVYVTKDGMETDQDLGNYERFLHEDTNWTNYVTTGQIYQEVIRKERNLEYGGEDVEVVPHVPEEIIRRLRLAGRKGRADIVIVEIGGTVGEYQNILFLEADRMLKRQFPHDVLNVHVSYLPIPTAVGEMKTKPVQYSVRTLNSAGIQPDMVIGRSAKPLDKKRRQKISVFCSVDEEDVISDPDVSSIYDIPMIFERQRLGQRLLQKLNMRVRKNTMPTWNAYAKKVAASRVPVRVGIIGKYFETGDYTLSDSYISVIESIKHAATLRGLHAEIAWINSEDFEKDPGSVASLAAYDGIIVPGGFGSRGVEGKIRAIQYCRENNIPYFGLCYGLQLAVIEFARNVLHLPGAHTEEIDQKTPHPVIHILPEQKKLLEEQKYGASMRLGAYACALQRESIAGNAYGARRITERHRHRFEVNNTYRKRLETAGMAVSGVNPERNLVEIMEIRGHPWFLGTQFHPEFQSRPMAPHPLFVSFLGAAHGRHEQGTERSKTPYQKTG